MPANVYKAVKWRPPTVYYTLSLGRAVYLEAIIRDFYDALKAVSRFRAFIHPQPHLALL